jgi:hypothetical protein
VAPRRGRPGHARLAGSERRPEGAPVVKTTITTITITILTITIRRRRIIKTTTVVLQQY